MKPKGLTPRVKSFVMARTASGRPALMHQPNPNLYSSALCGRGMTTWSRVYLTAREARPLIDLMACKRCGRIAEDV